ncbi:MAG: LPS assembly protein LptD [Candidatus Zixiibacteriota bacterium]
MRKHGAWFLFLILFSPWATTARAQGKPDNTIILEHSDILEVVMAPNQDTTFVVGSVRFRTESGTIVCDSAIWLKGKRVKLKGRVVVDDNEYRLTADSADYNLLTGEALARGSYVELWSRPDSLFAVGKQAFYDRNHKFFYMEDRPTLYIRYPDTASMIEVVSDLLEYDGLARRAQVSGNVEISSKAMKASSGCAVFHPQDNSVDLFERPVLKRGQSIISGAFIGITSIGKLLSRIDVIDSARGDFKEPIDSLKGYFDQSTLTGKRIIFDFDNGLLNTVTSSGQAYSWYYPTSRGSTEKNENSVSGDTIKFAVQDERLQAVTVIGGSMGSYLNSKTTVKDSLLQTKTDTIDYHAHTITYSLGDSTIALRDGSHVTSGTMALDAHRILFDTRTKIVKAYSADIPHEDSLHHDTTLTSRLQPNTIPVVLKDKSEELFGDYLEYSIDTQKGRVVQSKSKYETGFYYGESVFRANKRVFYVDNGRYTTCDADEPHFHFFSKHMKLIEGEKLIAKPVIFNIGRLPILALPYYVFPLKKGRHSGILPFRFGNFQQGERYIENVGYYWAASDYWDLQGSLGYIEKSSSLTLKSVLNYNKLYAFNGNVSAQVTRQTLYSYVRDKYAREETGSRYVVSASHTQQVTQSFWLSGNGQYQSDPRYFTDLSTNVADRLNRVVKSNLNFRKALSKRVLLSGAFSAEDQLDNGTRTVQFPSLSLSVPPLKPFGSGKLDENGLTKPRWYNSLSIQYTNGFLHYWNRNTITPPPVTVDTITTTFPSTYSRREYDRFNHGVSIQFPQTVAKYFVFNPNANYSENLFKIYGTDQSQTAGFQTSSGYRTYAANIGANLSTTIYGTVAPNLFGLTGLRQVLTPLVGYTFTPKTARHKAQAAFVGASAGSDRQSQSLSISLTQLYQAKVRHGDGEKALDLLSLTSSAGYDFQADSLRWSDISTRYQSNILPRVSVSGDFTHSFYRDGSSKPRYLNPVLTSFSFNTSFEINGSHFLFDEGKTLKKGADSASQISWAQTAGHPGSGTPGPAPSGSPWSLSVQYSYNQRGIGHDFHKSSFLTWGMHFNLTSTTRISYSQSFDPGTGSTVYNSVSISKTIHCWSGYLTWVPYGSTRGWAFSLYVTAIPAIKIDNSQSVVSSSLSQFR